MHAMVPIPSFSKASRPARPRFPLRKLEIQCSYGLIRVPLRVTFRSPAPRNLRMRLDLEGAPAKREFL